jgi:AcrR family transcriptional regulator
MKDYSKRQLEIISASIALIGEGGIQEFTVKNLSKKIGFVEAALYRHFPSKSDILVAVFSFLEAKVLERYNFIIKKECSATDKLYETIQSYIEYFSENPALVIVHLNDGIYKNEPVLQKKILSIMDDTKNHLECIINEGKEQILFRTDLLSSDLALMIMGLMRITVTRWSLQNDASDLKAQKDSVFGFIQSIIKI